MVALQFCPFPAELSQSLQEMKNISSRREVHWPKGFVGDVAFYPIPHGSYRVI